MEITFKVENSIKEILLNAIELDGQAWNIIHLPGEYNRKTYEYESMHGMLLEDMDFPESDAMVEYDHEENYAVITTAWSKFKYTLTQKDGYTEVTYRGAYKGFLAQELLPEMGQVDLEGAMVISSITMNRSTSLREYFMIREEMDAPQYGHKHPKKMYNHFALNAE